MVIVPLTQGKTALIDDEDADIVSRFKWCFHKQRRAEYAMAYVPQSGSKGKKFIYLHTLVLRFPKKNIDHISGDGLDCRKQNLREVTRTQNQRNQRTRCDNKTGFRGVVLRSETRRTKRYCSKIKVNGKIVFIGDFKTAREAAIAYNEASHKFFGEYGRRNIIPAE